MEILVGGILAQGGGWRTTMWFMAALAGAAFIAFLFAPETNVPRDFDFNENPNGPTTLYMLRRKDVNWHVNPFRSLAFLKYPTVSVTVCMVSIVFGSLFFIK